MRYLKYKKLEHVKEKKKKVKVKEIIKEYKDSWEKEKMCEWTKIILKE